MGVKNWYSSIFLELLVDITQFDIIYTTLVIDNFKIIVIDLKYDTYILIVIVADHVVCRVLTDLFLIYEATIDNSTVEFILQFQMIS
jgi:hypothetical protein